MPRLIQDEGVLRRKAERVDQNILCIKPTIDSHKLCIGPVIDLAPLCTDLGTTTQGIRYRADTTLLTADNTSISADYAL